MAEDIETIAGRLTLAQRDRLFAGSSIGCVCRHHQTREALIAKGLALPTNAGIRGTMLDWTLLGKQVRAHLQENPK